MRRIAVIVFASILLADVGFAQKRADSPTEAVLKFYRALREKRYVEGFRYSIYRGAVEGLSPAEMKELEPDFSRTFSEIPEKIEPRGEQIKGDSAVVSLKFDGVDEAQEVALVRVSGEWLVGDQQSLQVVKTQGRSFFFNTRMTVNEDEAFKMLARMIGAETIYSKKFDGRCASLQELIRLGGVPKDLETGEANGYRFTLALSQDQRSFVATAVPVVYGKTGRLSFYADLNGVRAEDVKGHLASATSPIYQPR